MHQLVRFVPVEVVSQVCILNGREEPVSFRIVSFLLIPSFCSGKPVITEYLIPEIYL